MKYPLLTKIELADFAVLSCAGFLFFSQGQKTNLPKISVSVNKEIIRERINSS